LAESRKREADAHIKSINDVRKAEEKANADKLLEEAKAAAQALANQAADEEREREKDALTKERIREENRLRKESYDLLEQLRVDEFTRSMTAMQKEEYFTEQKYAKQKEIILREFGATSEALTWLENNRQASLEAIRKKFEGGSAEAERIATMKERLSTEQLIEFEARKAMRNDLSAHLEAVTALNKEWGGTEEEALRESLARVREIYGEGSYEYLEMLKLVAAEKKRIDDESTAATIKNAQTEHDAMMSKVDNMKFFANAAEKTFGNLITIMKNNEKETKRMANVHKAITLTAIAIDTAGAIMKTMNGPGIVPYSMRVAQSIAIGAMGLTQAGAVISAQNKSTLPSAETGGSFTIPEMQTHRSDGQLIKVNPGETAQITPRSASSERDTTFQMVLNDEVLWENTQRGIDNGRITFTQANLVGAF
jgi:hypothetical protein